MPPLAAFGLIERSIMPVSGSTVGANNDSPLPQRRALREIAINISYGIFYDLSMSHLSIQKISCSSSILQALVQVSRLRKSLDHVFSVGDITASSHLLLVHSTSIERQSNL